MTDTEEVAGIKGAVKRLEESLDSFRVETKKGLDELKRAIMGDMVTGRGGLMSKVNTHSALIDQNSKEIGELKKEMGVVKRWIGDRDAQWRLVMIVSGGNILVLLGLIYMISRWAASGAAP